MKKVLALVLMASLLALSGIAMAEDLVYGTAALTYAEFYSGDVSSVEGIDAVSSATTGKSGSFPNVWTDFVDEETNKEGYHILGVQNVNIALSAADVDAYKALNPTFAESSEVPVQYKTVTIENGKAVYSATQLNVAATVEDAELEVVTDSHWGDYQVNVLETTTKYIRNTRQDEGFSVASGIQGIIVETASGLKVGMEHLASIWIQPWEISWNVTVDNRGNSEIAYDNTAELDKLMGETITKITFLNQNDSYVYQFAGAYLPIKFPSSLSAADADSAALTSAYEVTGLPEDYEQVYTVEGLDITAADGSFSWTADVAGAYTLELNDAAGKYARLSADFVLHTDVLPVAYDEANHAVVLAEGADEAMAAAFLKNLVKASINGKEYSVSGRGAVALVDADGEVDLDAAVTQGRGDDAVETPVFAEGENEVTLTATGFETPLSFVVNK